jgi:hypothetical protein
VAIEDATSSTAADRKAGKVTAFERAVEAKATGDARNPPSPNPSIELLRLTQWPRKSTTRPFLGDAVAAT